jgi:hypothetical protein
MTTYHQLFDHVTLLSYQHTDMKVKESVEYLHMIFDEVFGEKYVTRCAEEGSKILL